ncbi:MAG: hypothetical protein P4L50_29450 [Anaerolineaceae bacterium]|nr:hypothetical protein [Anaerolineaceae bacterium]
MAEWRYCTIETNIHPSKEHQGHYEGQIVITYLKSDKDNIVTKPFLEDDEVLKELINKLNLELNKNIANLGKKGWELMWKTTIDKNTSNYFLKRKN